MAVPTTHDVLEAIDIGSDSHLQVMVVIQLYWTSFPLSSVRSEDIISDPSFNLKMMDGRELTEIGLDILSNTGSTKNCRSSILNSSRPRDGGQ